MLLGADGKIPTNFYEQGGGSPIQVVKHQSIFDVGLSNESRIRRLYVSFVGAQDGEVRILDLVMDEMANNIVFTGTMISDYTNPDITEFVRLDLLSGMLTTSDSAISNEEIDQGLATCVEVIISY